MTIRAFTDLVCDYIDSLGFHLDFQDVQTEISEVQHVYGDSGRGAALLVVNQNGSVVGIAALRDMGDGKCELKRMYLKPDC